jgi:hypothetical protein
MHVDSFAESSEIHAISSSTIEVRRVGDGSNMYHRKVATLPTPARFKPQRAELTSTANHHESRKSIIVHLCAVYYGRCQ